MSATKTVILGGGFGGISAANTLRGLLGPEHEIVVIDESARFHVGAGKTWIMLGERSSEQISRPRASLLAPGVTLVEAKVGSIGLSERTVSHGRESLKWDHLVIALGADLALSRVPGLKEAAHTFYTIDGAQRLKVALEQFSGGDVVILIPRVPFKCPPAPYEAAMLLHHAFEERGLAAKARLEIHTTEGAPMATAGPEMGRYIKGELEQRGIEFFPQKTTARVDGRTKRVIFEDESEARYDLLIAIPPHEAPQVVRDAHLTNASGWIPVDPKTMHVKQPPTARDVYAIGDVTVVPLPGRYKPDVGLSLPKAGVFAEAHGRIAAHQIAAQVLGRAPDEEFDGKGFCYLETGAHQAVKAEGSFFDLPHPVMQKHAPDEAQYRDKVDWIEGLLRPQR
jgi:sulfide:quinone oxidoreductase